MQSRIKKRGQGLSHTNNRAALRQESGKMTLKGSFVNEMVMYKERSTITLLLRIRKLTVNLIV